MGALCLALFGIYSVQSLVTGMATQALPAILRNVGASLQTSSLAFLILAPWVLKGLWAPWIERWRLPPGRAERRSRPLILAGQALVAVLLIMLATLGSDMDGVAPVQVRHVAAIVALLAMGALATATVDIAVDGYAIEQLAAHQRGWGNVAQVGGSYVGLALGGSVFVLLYERAGWPMATAAMAVLALAFTWPLWRLREPPRSKADAASNLHHAHWRHAWQSPAMRSGLLLVLGMGLGVRLCSGMLGPWLLDQGVGITVLAAFWGVGGLGAGLAGTLVGGLLVQRAGGWRALHMALALEAMVLVMLAIGAALKPPAEWQLGLSALLLAAMACGFVARYAWLMGVTHPRQPGLDFTLLQCTDAAVALLGGLGGGWLAGQAGHATSFAVAAGLGLGALALPTLMRRWGALPAPTLNANPDGDQTARNEGVLIGTCSAPAATPETKPDHDLSI